ncbi:hypothetical protein AUP42_18525 [Thalassospira lucentensis]|uniref:Uncharacterized protein n=1 Tax=Thalassospira lucentensis TaxID=168935 RepID=A0A154L6H6_9PROT|nr:transporter substrate-binding domain-containing protein [Thalassospira lucentensis]KZB64845.1 hypothetical protein AUP42_18525 [Thalassospira lucentensis]
MGRHTQSWGRNIFRQSAFACISISRLCLAAFGFALILNSSSAGAQDFPGSPGEDAFLILQTNLQPPYQQLQDGILQGYSITVLNCAFDRIGVGYGIAIAPRQRNREMVRNGQADGFFLARISPIMDEYADPTLPLALEKWVWISAAGQQGSFAAIPAPESLLSVGAILGSNEAEWLVEQGYHEIAKVPSINSLISQVLAGRVEYALVDKQTFEAARDDMGHHETQFNIQFERYAPLVVYFGREYTRRNPDLIAALNTALRTCETLPMRLEDWERDLITRQQLPMIRSMAGDPKLIAAVRSALGGADARAGALADLDREWRRDSERGVASAKATEILENPLSGMLRSFQEDDADNIAEIFVFNTKGAVIGMNRLTSDFDQSDEPKFKVIIRQDPDLSQIADIYFDGSTRTFLSQVTVPVIDPDTGNIIAAMTVGLDVSGALRPDS